MPGSGTWSFADPDDYRERLERAGATLVITDRGVFKARLTWATLHQLHLQRNEEELPRIAHVSLTPALVFVGFTTRPDPPMLWGGVELPIPTFPPCTFSRSGREVLL